MAQVILCTDKSEVEEITIAAASACRPVKYSYRTAGLSYDVAYSLVSFSNISLSNQSLPFFPYPRRQNSNISQTADAFLCTIHNVSNKDEEA